MYGLEVLTLMRAQRVGDDWDRPSSGDWADVLASVPLFSGVGKRQLRKLVKTATSAEFSAGDSVLVRGESTDSLYVILEGAARVPGAPAARALGVGDYFGEVAVIDGGPRSATVVATEQLHVMRLPSRSVMQLAERHRRITLTILNELTARVRRLETQLAPSG